MSRQTEIRKAKDKDLGASLAAIKRAAALARKVAIQTATAIVLIKGGKQVRVTAEQLRRETQLHLPQIFTDSDFENRLNLLELRTESE